MITFLTSARTPWGAERSMAEIISSVEKAGQHTQVVTCSDSVADFLRARIRSDVTTLTVDTSDRIARIGAFGREALRRTVRKRDPIVLFSPNLYQLAVLLKVCGRTVVLDLHDDFGDTRARAMLRLWLRIADGGIAISKYVETQAGNENCVVIPRPISSDDLLTEFAPIDPRSVAIAGRLVPEKQIGRAIDAVAEIGDVQLHIFGAPFDGSQRYERELIAHANRVAPGRVHFHGQCTPREIYRSAGVVLVANEREASGRTVGEGMLARRVALVPSAGGAREFVDDGVTGFVWNADHGAEGIGRALLRIIARTDLETLGAAARAAIMRERNPALVGARYAAALGAFSGRCRRIARRTGRP